MSQIVKASLAGRKNVSKIHYIKVAFGTVFPGDYIGHVPPLCGAVVLKSHLSASIEPVNCKRCVSMYNKNEAPLEVF